MTFTSNLDKELYQEIWDASLETVPEPKYRQAEAWDLFQCLEWALGVPGDVVEFGTYRGHSGWLMAEFLRRKGSDKVLWLFDTFDQFPKEEGEDAQWSGTHQVDFDEVQTLFEPFENVRLVQGDFTVTALKAGVGIISFVHVDCDSYRGTAFAAGWAWDRGRWGSLALFQDYGQPQCDGARRAVDEFLDDIGCLRWFSYRSGCMIVWM